MIGLCSVATAKLSTLGPPNNEFGYKSNFCLKTRKPPCGGISSVACTVWGIPCPTWAGGGGGCTLFPLSSSGGGGGNYLACPGPGGGVYPNPGLKTLSSISFGCGR